MGMDVFGNNPSSKTGAYFRNNVWWWRPLWVYCCHVAPILTRDVVYGQSNDGDGLGAAGSRSLAAILNGKIADGSCERYAKDYETAMSEMADEECNLCGGTGKRVDMEARDGCNKCHGVGKLRPSATDYSFSTENVQEFAAFLAECGGFRIC